MAAPRTGLLGKKLGMSQVFNEQGNRVGVTVVHAGKCVVLSKRTPDKHGYVAVQIGYGEKPLRLCTKPELGQVSKLNVPPPRVIRELRLDAAQLAQLRADLDVALLFLRLGTTAFGGPAAHIALMRHEVVVRRGWLSEARFLDLLLDAALAVRVGDALELLDLLLQRRDLVKQEVLASAVLLEDAATPFLALEAPLLRERHTVAGGVIVVLAFVVGEALIFILLVIVVRVRVSAGAVLRLLVFGLAGIILRRGLEDDKVLGFVSLLFVGHVRPLRPFV